MIDKNTSLSAPEVFTTFGELLRYLRRRAGLTQRELSLEVGYSEPQISFLEKNHRLPDVTTVKARFIPALDLEYESPLAQRLIQLAQASHIENQPILEAPYKGLQFFDVQDADMFYGRELLTARLVRHLRKHQFLAIIVGASGSGKSSIVRAGLVPALQRGQRMADGGLPPPGSAHWKYLVITPGTQPLKSLINALEEDKVDANDLSDSIQDFITDETRLDMRARVLLNTQKRSQASPRGHILLIVDQFEELFTMCEDEDVRRAFIDNLMFSASEQSARLISVVITLRADFYVHCAQHPILRDRLAHSQEYIGQMSAEEIRRAIEQPALNSGLTFEPGLVDLILKEAGDEPGALPLVSHVLLETWKRRQNQTLTFRGYNQSGGIRGAIAKTAENVYSKLDKEQQSQARLIFLALTELGQTSEEGLLIPDTRRRVSLNELNVIQGATGQTESLLKLLSDARLITVTENSVEVAHEALIREWPRLKEWLSEDREHLLLHRHLNTAAARWDANGRIPEDLYRGSRLSQTLEWTERYRGELSSLASEFLDASRSWSEREIAEREAQRRKELFVAQRLAESESQRAEDQKRASQRLQRRAWILSGLLLVAGVLAVAAFGLSRQRDITAQLATSRELASSSISNLEVDPERSILLALEALSIAHTREAEEALHQAVFASRVEIILRGHKGLVGVAVYNPDGSQIATAGEDGDIRLWEPHSGKNILTLSGHEGPVYEVIFNSNGKRIASAGEDGTARIWDSASGEMMMTFKGKQNAVIGLAFSPDTTRLATGGVDGSVVVWDSESGMELQRFHAHKMETLSIAFTPDGQQLVTSSFDDQLIFWDVVSAQKLRTWEGEFGNMVISKDGRLLMANFGEGGKIIDIETGEELVKTAGHTNVVSTAAVNADWTRIATAGLDRKVVISAVDSGRILFILSGHTGEILDAQFSPDGKHLVTASADGTARIWNAGPASESVTMQTHDSWGRIALSLDGKFISVGDERNLKVWDIENGQERYSFEMPDRATGVAFDPTGSRLAGGTEKGDIVIWDIQSGAKLLEIKASDILIFFLAFSRDGSKLASGSEDQLVKVWDSKNGKLLLNLAAHRYPVTSVMFSPDSKRLASGGVDNLALIWDAISGEKLLSLQGHTDAVWGITYSPDGKRIATASSDSTARIWDTESGRELLRLSDHTSTVVSIAFSPDGTQLATTGRDGITKLWDANSGDLLINLYGNGDGLIGVAFSPDGKRLTTVGQKVIHVYLLKLDDLIGLAKTRVTRSLTEKECLQYLHTRQCPVQSP